MAARDSYFGAVTFGLITLGVFYDFQRGYRRDLRAAHRWREQRWNAWKALEKEYRDEVYRDMPPSVAELNARLNVAEKRAADDIAERFGPIT
jgi:hypothetical protein